jgi:tripartite ATP-independent transporter DctM subunit
MKRPPIGWFVLATFIVALAVFVNIPVALLALAFCSGSPLFTIMLGATALGAWSGVIHLTNGGPMDEFNGNVAMIQHVGLGDEVETMSTIPLFIYAGYLLAESGTADRLVRFANAAIGWIPGGLAIVTILTCALFTVFTGGSGVTIIALGGVLMPALVRQGYPERFSMGLIAGTGSVGLLFPPALPLFIYGTVYGLVASKSMQAIWDTRRFLFAGILPGWVLIGMLFAVAIFVAVKRKLPRQKFDARELGESFLLAIPELGIPFGVLIGLVVFGFGLPEIAALTVVYTVVLEIGLSRIIPKWGKPLEPRVLWTTSREALAMVGAIFIIIFASTALTDFMVNAEVPRKIVAWTQDHVHSKLVFLLAINVILLIVGTVMDIFSAIVVVLPLVAPIAEKFGVDPYHLGVIFLLNLEVGYLHPPVGLNLFITSVKFQRPITEVMWATIPFLITMIVALLTVTYVPQVTEASAALSPYDPARSSRTQDLASMVHVAAEELTVIRDITLVDLAGKPIAAADGKPIVKHLSECDTLSGSDKDGCQRVFFDVKNCKGDQACAHVSIAKWVVDNNTTSVPIDKQIVLVTEVPLITLDGKPKTDKSGAPIVKKVADCAKDDDTCRDLFLSVTNCKIDPGEVNESYKGDPDRCTRLKVGDWVEANASTDAP